MIDFDKIYQNVYQGNKIPKWLVEFKDSPVDALGSLLLHVADLERYQVDEPTNVLDDWMVGLQSDDFVVAVDEALAAWIDQSWGVKGLPRVNGEELLTRDAWWNVVILLSQPDRFDLLPLAYQRLIHHRQVDGDFLPSMLTPIQEALLDKGIRRRRDGAK